MRNGRCIVKVAPCAQRALDGEPAAMPVEHVLDQRQTQTGAALRAAVGDVDPVESLGQPRQMLGRDAGAVVAHRHARFRRAGAGLRRAQA